MRFTKMHGAGNDYIYVDCFTQTIPTDVSELARKISDRRFGVGADGLILICPSDGARQPYAKIGFGKFQDDMTSYTFTVQPDDLTYPDCIIARCPIHHNYLMADGSVQQINPEKIREYQKDGRYYLAPVANPTTNSSGQKFMEFTVPAQ